MAYTKNSPAWTSTEALTSARMNALETQYDLAYADFVAHDHDTRYNTQSVMNSTYWYSGNDGTGTGCDADLIYTPTGNLHASDFAGVGVPVGLIIMWSGSVATIPTGWNLCDGNNGTSDLRNKFIPGSGSDYAVNASGGYDTRAVSGTLTVATHILTLDEMPQHRHSITDYYHNMGARTWSEVPPGLDNITSHTINTGAAGSGQAHGHTGSTITGDAYDNKPPYYALCLIQKS